MCMASPKSLAPAEPLAHRPKTSRTSACHPEDQQDQSWGLRQRKGLQAPQSAWPHHKQKVVVAVCLVSRGLEAAWSHSSWHTDHMHCTAAAGLPGLCAKTGCSRCHSFYTPAHHMQLQSGRRANAADTSNAAVLLMLHCFRCRL
jgi:hypothetical protein